MECKIINKAVLQVFPGRQTAEFTRRHQRPNSLHHPLPAVETTSATAGMSGARGFHYSSGDNFRPAMGARTLAFDKGGSMGDILGGGGARTDPAPPPRHGGGVAALFGGEETPTAGSILSHRKMLAIPGRGNSMSDIMQGIGAMGVDDNAHGISKRPPPNSRHSGTGVLSALRGEAAEAGMEDPFAHVRARPKRHPRDVPQEPPVGAPPAADGVSASDRAAFEGLSRAHATLVAAAAKAPRDESGALVDYKPLLAQLAAQGLPLNADAAGTLIATLDVRGTISFDEFMDVIALGLGPEPAAAAPTVPVAAAPPQPMSVRAPPTGVARPPPARLAQPPPQPPTPQDASSLLGGRRVADAASSAQLAAVLNRSAGQHARRSDLDITVSKSAQFR
jgi:hypothetical protein